jgi:hypothetical protein
MNVLTRAESPRAAGMELATAYNVATPLYAASLYHIRSLVTAEGMARTRIFICSLLFNAFSAKKKLYGVE